MTDTPQGAFSPTWPWERADVVRLGASLRQDLAARGMAVRDVDRARFRDAPKGTGSYKHWRARFGDEAWSVLEATTGSLT